MDQCQWPQVFNNEYLAAKGSIYSQDSVVVYDIEDIQTPILTLHQVPYQVVVVIDDLQISQQAEITISLTTSIFHGYTLRSTPSQMISSAVMTSTLIPSSSLLTQSPMSNAVSIDDPTLTAVDNFNLMGTVIFPVVLIIVVAIVTVVVILLVLTCR